MERPERLLGHGLFSQELRPIHNWHEWMERWNATTLIEEKVGLLHAGLEVPLETSWHEPAYGVADRYLFYLRIADGWNNSRMLESAKDSGEYHHYGHQNRKTLADLRQTIAREAFDMLAQTFFKHGLRGTEHQHYNPINRDLVLSEEVLLALQHFFRPQEAWGDSIEIRNFPRGDKLSDKAEEAIHFLWRLQDLLWKWEEPKVGSWEKAEEQERNNALYAAMRARVKAAKLWMIEILCFARKLDRLRNRDIMLFLGSECMAKLKEIALRTELSEYGDQVTKTRRATTIQEACYGRSDAGFYLLEYEVVRREHTRLSGIRAAEQKVKEAQRKIKELSSK